MNNQSLKLLISNSGDVTAIYADEHVPMMEAGHATVKRASHVEPDASGLWWADMSPTGKPDVLGPFRLRSEALDAEVQYLEKLLFS